MEQSGGLIPGNRSTDRIVIHVDMDCFYAACERLREPKLRDEPVVVGMGYEEGDDVGAVATASYEARAHGVESAQAITTALERLPRKSAIESDPDADSTPAGYYRPVDMEYYQSIAEEVKEILHEWADTVRAVSIDEAYLDVTDRTKWSVAAGYARHVKQEINTAVGVTASIGVAPNMSTAKIASDHDKPDGLVVISPDEVREFLAPLPIEDLHGIGPVTATELRDDGIETIGDLASATLDTIDDRYGDRGRELVHRARGTDDREVIPMGKPKSLSRESAFSEPVDSLPDKQERLTTLAAAVADRAQRKGALYQTIGIKVVEPPFDIQTRERSLPGPIDDPELLEDVALELLEEFAETPLRKLGVRISNLDFADHDQSALEGWEPRSSRSTDSVIAGSLTPNTTSQLIGQTTISDFLEPPS